METERILRINRGGDLNASSDDGRRFSLSDVHALLTRHRRLESLTAEIRACTDKETRKELKKGLPAVEFNSVCDGLRRMENVVRTTGYIVVDIDGLQSLSQARTVRDNLFSDTRLGCVLAFVSVSGKGVKAVLNIGEDKVTADNIKDWYAAAAWYLKSTYSIAADTNACDAVRLCFLSNDPDARLAEDGRECCVELSWASLSRKPKPAVQERVVLKASGGTTTALQKLLVGFAKFCVTHNVSFLQEYNVWIGFAVEVRNIFGGSSDGLSVWDSCSRFSHNYDRRDLVEKWERLPAGGGEITAVQMLWNFAKSPIGESTGLRGWLVNRLSLLGLGTTRVTYK